MILYDVAFDLDDFIDPFFEFDAGALPEGSAGDETEFINDKKSKLQELVDAGLS